MAVSASPELTRAGADADRRIEIDLAAGWLRVEGPGLALEGLEFGLLQTAPRWSSVTALVRDATAGLLGAVLIVDESGGEVTLQVDGRPALVWRLTS